MGCDSAFWAGSLKYRLEKNSSLCCMLMFTKARRFLLCPNKIYPCLTCKLHLGPVLPSFEVTPAPEQSFPAKKCSPTLYLWGRMDRLTRGCLCCGALSRHPAQCKNAAACRLFNSFGICVAHLLFKGGGRGLCRRHAETHEGGQAFTSASNFTFKPFLLPIPRVLYSGGAAKG